MPGVGDLGSIFALALLAMVNPTLLAASTVMMLLPETKKLMFGYLLGAYLTSISVGIAIVFALHGSASVNSAKQTLSPLEDLVIGALLITVGVVLRTGRAERLGERRKRRREEKPKKESLPERMLGRGSARITFVVGLLLSFPGVSYLAALDKIAKLKPGVVPSVLLVIVFCLIQMILLELPLIGYAVAPERTQERVVAFRGWLGRNGRRAGGAAAIVLGGLLVLRGVIELITG
jgi:hypothetical protein